jgi:hypothetical protein
MPALQIRYKFKASLGYIVSRKEDEDRGGGGGGGGEIHELIW